MLSVDVWQGIDRLAFHENAILLDVKVRSQADPIRSAIHNHDHVESQDGLTPQIICDVLDDFALVLSGSGGKDNVSAACMEYDEELRTITLRISSNDGIERLKHADLQRLLQLITNVSGPNTEMRREEVLIFILQQCATSFVKHVNKFMNELKQAQCPGTHLRFPAFPLHDRTAESATDIDHLGPYNHDSHQAYMLLSSERLQNLRKISGNLTTSGIQSDVSEMGRLAKAAYGVQLSSSFYHFLRYNLLASKKPMAVQLMAQSLKERLGKMSRYWRAAKTLTAFGSAMIIHDFTVNLLCLPTSRQPVREICRRTPAQLRSRGGLHFQSCNNGQLQGKLGQWQSYRLHCEMQLVIFYEENPHLQLRSHYIGCNKLACYLCYNFITNHGQFQVKGCHQGLYSLWTVPLTINFATHERASEFSSALRQLAHILENKVDSIRRASKSQWKYRTNNESTANLSRISLQWPSLRGATTKATTEVSAINESRLLSQPRNQSRRHDSSERYRNNLETPPSTNIAGDRLAMQPAQCPTLDRVPVVVASTTQTRGNTGTDIDVQPTWNLGATLPAPRECRNLSTAAITSPVPPLLHIEISKNDTLKVPRSQDNAPATASQEIGRSPLSLPLDSTSLAPQMSSSKEENCSQCQDEQGEEETSSPGQRQAQVRLSTDLVYEQNYHSAHIIGDHESRTSDMPSKHGTREEQTTDQFRMPCLNGMSRTFDFHETSLFLEIECPRSAQVNVLQCSRPQRSTANPVVEVDKIEPGESVDFDMGEDFSKTRLMFLIKRNNNGIDQWLECRWK
ncbi:hypothetical protein HRR78_000514 [Exophiala dermatitidis]|nr:hypothetical protein HRR75_001421 [Exophiala dermatitidis]KAJ4559991.1 hypothetical protein HRR78_000514 [Exophiala dermatitidis]